MSKATSSKAFLATFFALFPAASAAEDLLPLRQGIYVVDDVACSGLSHAVTMSFWGNELNSQRTIGAIRQVERDGDRYLLTIDLNEAGTDAGIKNWVLRIPGAESFIMDEPAPAKAYRWCFDSMP